MKFKLLKSYRPKKKKRITYIQHCQLIISTFETPMNASKNFCRKIQFLSLNLLKRFNFFLDQEDYNYLSGELFL